MEFKEMLNKEHKEIYKETYEETYRQIFPFWEQLTDEEQQEFCHHTMEQTVANISDKNLAVKAHALELAVERFSDVMWVMQQILFMSMDKRLAIFLYDEYSKSGSCLIPLSNEQIAKYMGSAREVVSRMMKYFKEEGIAIRSKDGVEILDLQKLKTLAIR